MKDYVIKALKTIKELKEVRHADAVWNIIDNIRTYMMPEDKYDYFSQNISLGYHFIKSAKNTYR